MKLIVTIFTVLILAGCCEPGSEPSPPYGRPDDTSTYEGSEGYRSIDYTYYCYGGQYISVSYVRKDNCSDYAKDSEYRSSGICGGEALRDRLEQLSPKAGLLLLIATGRKIDTIRVSSPRDSGFPTR